MNRNDERGSEEFHGRKSVPFPQQCFWEILTFKNYNVEDSEIWSEDAFLSFHFSANFIGWNANPWPVNVNSVNLIPQPSRLSFLDGSTKLGFQGKICLFWLSSGMFEKFHRRIEPRDYQKNGQEHPLAREVLFGIWGGHFQQFLQNVWSSSPDYHRRINIQKT